MSDDDSLCIASWNINGIRAAHKKGLGRWLGRCGADIVALQETRAELDQIPQTLRKPRRWKAHYVSAERKGYSGVGILSKTPADEHITSLGKPEFDSEGRVLMARFGKLTVVSGYFPNGNGKQRDNSRVPYKLRFYRRLFRVLDEEMRAGGRIVVLGDYNTAHEEIDLARPKQNRGTSGFLPEERRAFAQLLKAGWVDTFRALNPDVQGRYTWWSQRFGVRAKNVGWRLDYALASPGAAEYLRDARIHAAVMGSDHCPIDVVLDRRVLD